MTWKQPASSMTEPMNQDFHFSGGTTVRGDPVIDVRRRSGCIGADRQRIAGTGRYIAAISMVVGLAFSLPALAQAPAVTATCKDGTTFSGATRSGACRGHKGVQSWGDASSPAAPTTAPAASPTPSNDAGANHARDARQRPSMGQYELQGLPLSRRPRLRAYQAGDLHDGSCRQSRGGWAQPREGLLLIGP
jgi:hypothetical protein